jgi:hypothetical protein
MIPVPTLLSILAFLSCSGAALAAGGPPMVTDDPGTPGTNKIELNLAVTSELSSNESRYETPILDMNYGLGSRIQLKYEVPWVLSKRDEGSESGFDRSIAGVKWRFLDKETTGVAVSTYPQVAFRSPVSEKLRNQNTETSRQIILPIETEETRENWEFNQEVGYQVLDSGVNNQYLYGAAITYNVNDGLAFLGELHGNAYKDFRDHNLLANVGSVIGLNKTLSLLVSAGKTLKAYQGDEAPFLGYAGMQFHL